MNVQHSGKVVVALGMALLTIVATGFGDGRRESAAATEAQGRLLAAFHRRADASCRPIVPLQTELSFDTPPLPGQPVRLTFNVLAMQDCPNPEIKFSVPSGVTLRSGLPRMSGAVLPGGRVHSYSAAVSFDRPGDYVLEASAMMGQPNAVYGRVDRLYVRATAGGIQVFDELPLRRDQTDPEMIAQPTPAGERIAAPSKGVQLQKPSGTPDFGVKALGTAATAEVHGYWRYRHGDGTVHGGYGTTVIALDQDSAGATVLGTTVCDPTGYFSITFDNATESGTETGTADVYLLFASYNDGVSTVGHDGNNYYTTSGLIFPDITPGSHYAGSRTADWGTAGVSDSTERAYQVQDTMTQAWAFSSSSLGHDTHLTKAVWYRGSTDGTYYTIEDDTIHLSDVNYDSPAVVVHEYGHSHMDSVYQENYIPNSGGAHWFENHYNPALAMSEGYATYYSCIVRNDHWYDDKDPGNFIHWDCELNWDGYGAANGNVDGLGNGYDTESAVLALLLDLEDTHNSPDDPFDWSSEKRSAIYDVMRNYPNATTRHPYTMQELFNGWAIRGWGARPKLNGQMQVHGMDQGVAYATIGIVDGIHLSSTPWTWNGPGDGWLDIMNYGSRPYSFQSLRCLLSFPDLTDTGQFGTDSVTRTLASGETLNVVMQDRHIGKAKNLKGSYRLWVTCVRPSDGVGMSLMGSDFGVSSYLAPQVVADTTGPDYCTVTDDGDWQNNLTSLHFVVHADDSNGAIKGYWTRVGTSAGSGDVKDWEYHAAYAQTTFETTLAGLSLSPNVKYFISVVARNTDDLDTWGYADGIYCGDLTPPGPVTVTDDGSYTTNGTQLHFRAATSEDTVMAGFWTRIGTSKGGWDIEDWKFYPTTSTTFEHTTTGLTLVSGTTYHITVVARNAYGKDTYGYSDGIAYYPSATLSGRVHLKDFMGMVAGRYIDIAVRDASGQMETFRKRLEADGGWSVVTHLEGPVTVKLKCSHWLRKNVSVQMQYPATTGVSATLINGDVDGDNAVTVFDYNALSAAFESMSGDPHWNSNADLDGDGVVSVFDYNILSSSFDTEGDQ